MPELHEFTDAGSGAYTVLDLFKADERSRELYLEIYYQAVMRSRPGRIDFNDIREHYKETFHKATIERVIDVIKTYGLARSLAE